MSQSFIDTDQFEKIILENWKIIDVRAPVEFAIAELPNSINIPILENDEREKVGTCYKREGREAAIRLGHSLVDESKRAERIQKWSAALQNEKSLITCWRGGLRSQISQSWTADVGTQRPRLKGGYKAIRNYLLEEFASILRKRNVIVVSGTTGSGKTLCLRAIENSLPVLDMEGLGRHRGSAFGAYDEAQPAQATYENRLATQLIKIDRQWSHGPLILEDESRMLGKLVNPEILFDKLRASPVVVIDEPIEVRTEIIFADYIIQSGLTDPHRQERVAARYRHAMQAISKKLGGLRYAEVLKDLNDAITRPDDHRVWIAKLLNWYYDPLYRKSLETRQPKIQFRGTRQEVSDFLLAETKSEQRLQ